MEGGQGTEDGGQSDKGCCLWNKEHRINAEASQSLKGNQYKRTKER